MDRLPLHGMATEAPKKGSAGTGVGFQLAKARDETFTNFPRPLLDLAAVQSGRGTAELKKVSRAAHCPEVPQGGRLLEARTTNFQ
jgi:hypothetical protein